MKAVVYILIKKVVQIAFFCYYQNVAMDYKKKIPGKTPIMFLPNHQNALMDPLIIAAFSKRKPYFITRSDVFVNNFFNAVFNLLRMVPIYRFRDGRDTLKRNKAIFNTCADLLNNNEALVIFPEGNHQIRKMVRPLSKGFTRILFTALEINPDLDIHLVPVGINYKTAEKFPDRTRFIFGNPIRLQELIADSEWSDAIPIIKDAVYNQLVELTTHVQPSEDYEEIMEYLEAEGCDFMDPNKVNQLISGYRSKDRLPTKKRNRTLGRIVDFIFLIVNLPVLLPWKLFFKKRIKEIEFLATYRFAYAIIAFPIYYAYVFYLFNSYTPYLGFAAVALLFTHNLLYVKLR